MKKILLIFFLAFSIVNAKEELDWVAFASGIDGTSSSSVNEMDELVKDKDIEEIKELLFSENVALKGLSVYVLEILKEKEIIDLDSIELNQISILYSSNEELVISSGCEIEFISTLGRFLSFNGLIKWEARERYTKLIEEYYRDD